MRAGPVYFALEIGIASLHIPFVSVTLGYESKARYVPPDDDELFEPAPQEEAAKRAPPEAEVEQPEAPRRTAKRAAAEPREPQPEPEQQQWEAPYEGRLK